jgi:hypothetical protein
MRRQHSQREEVQACEHQNGWREEWLLDSGSTVNLTNKKSVNGDSDAKAGRIDEAGEYDDDTSVSKLPNDTITDTMMDNDSDNQRKQPKERLQNK